MQIVRRFAPFLISANSSFLLVFLLTASPLLAIAFSLLSIAFTYVVVSSRKVNLSLKSVLRGPKLLIT